MGREERGEKSTKERVKSTEKGKGLGKLKRKKILITVLLLTPTSWLKATETTPTPTLKKKQKQSYQKLGPYCPMTYRNSIFFGCHITDANPDFLYREAAMGQQPQSSTHLLSQLMLNPSFHAPVTREQSSSSIHPYWRTLVYFYEDD